MSRIKIIPILLFAAIVGSCSKDETTVGGGGNTTGAISLSTTVSWATRGASVEDIKDVTELTLYSFDAYGEVGTDWESATSLAPFFTNDTTTPLTLTTSDEGVTWDYTATTGGLRYWRADNAEAITFFALYPESELTTTFNETTGKPEFAYSMSELAADNHDLVIDAHYDLNNTAAGGEKVQFDLQHALTKLTLKAKIYGTLNDDNTYYYMYEDQGGVTVYGDSKYFINGISFSGLYNGATLDIDLNGDGTRTIRWTLDVENTIEVTAAQDNTVMPIFTTDEVTGDEILNASALLTDALKSVMETGEAIYMLPQQLGDNRDVAPTVTVRVRRLYYTEDDVVKNGTTGEPEVYYEYENFDGSFTSGEGFPTNVPANIVGEVTYSFQYNTDVPSGEMIYSTDAIVIPSADGTDGWVQGYHNVLEFTFDLENINSYIIPMTLMSSIYGWTEVDVEATVLPNIYIYSSDSDIELSSNDETAEVYIYTNYTYDLRRHKRNIELDGSSTEAAGFTFYSSTGNRYEPLVVIENDGVSTDYYYVYDSNNVLYLSTSSTGLENQIEISQTDGVADLSGFEDDGWMTFKIKPTDEEGYDDAMDFTYKVKKSTRDLEELYINSAVETDYYGVNKSASDAVYILSLIIEDDHLYKPGDNYGYFEGSLGAELLSNGGGKVIYKFDVSLKKAL
ncbi:MAG: fimbrillin family protein [Rikenellaceae bacterium]